MFFFARTQMRTFVKRLRHTNFIFVVKNKVFPTVPGNISLIIMFNRCPMMSKRGQNFLWGFNA